jgi:hypothetical protein
MKVEQEQYQDLIKLFLPEEIFKYFELIKLDVVDNEIHVYLDEGNILPEEYEKEKLITKGFHSSITIQDFPIRDKPLFLHVRRRQWLVVMSGQYVSRNWDTVAKGTRLTKDFVTFLKGILG